MKTEKVAVEMVRIVWDRIDYEQKAALYLSATNEDDHGRLAASLWRQDPLFPAARSVVSELEIDGYLMESAIEPIEALAAEWVESRPTNEVERVEIDLKGVGEAEDETIANILRAVLFAYGDVDEEIQISLNKAKSLMAQAYRSGAMEAAAAVHPEEKP